MKQIGNFALQIFFCIEFFTKLYANSDSASKDLAKTDIKIEYQFYVNPQDIKQSNNLNDIDGIIKRKQLIVCAKKDKTTPIFMKKINENEFTGADIDFAKFIGKTLGVDVVFKMIYESYGDVVTAVQNGEGDIGISEISFTNLRSRQVFYSSPYVIAKKAILINRVALEKSNPKTLKNFLNEKKQTLAIEKGSAYEEYAKNLFPNAKLLIYKNFQNDIVPDLLNGKVDAAMFDEFRVKLLIQENPKLSIKLLPIILKEENDSISSVISYKNPKLLLYVNEILEKGKMIKNVDELIKKYEENAK